MDWREKSVTLGNVQKERFNTKLAHVTVSETRITVAYKDAEDWKRIRREVGTDILLEETALEAIQDVDASEEHLYYPHIDLTVATDDGKEEKRIYFMEDEEDDFHACLKAIRRFWNAQRQRGAPHRDSYTYGEEDEDEAETEDAAGDEEGAGGEESDDQETAPEPESGGGDEAEEAAEPAEEVELTAALKRQNSLTHRLSEGIKNEAAHFKELLPGGDDTEEDTEAEPEAEEEEEEDGKGLADRVSDEIRNEIDRFRHIGEDGEKKEADDAEDKEDTEEEEDADEADDDGDTEEQEEEQSPVEDVVDRFTGQ